MSPRTRFLLTLLGLWSLGCADSRVVDVPPNIILILADDLGYGDIGSYGQEQVFTPNLDSLASEGIRFTQFYAGSTVCAPSRSVLMTGLHTGHTPVRGNAGPEKQTLLPEDRTIAEVLRDAGYTTALIGKWGLGDEGNTGRPNDQGFDHFFGYLNQVHAHNYYPEFLWRNEQKVPLRNVVERAARPYGGFHGGAARTGIDYSHDLFVDEAVAFIESNEANPFFLYLALTIPHANNEAPGVLGRHGQEVPDYGPYSDRDWPEPQKGTAAMISRMDDGIGRIIQTLDECGLTDKTIVFFSSDNGPHAEGGNDPDFFDSNGRLRGIKRALFEGGIRVPFIVWGPGNVASGFVSDHIGYFGDVYNTLEDLAGLQRTDSLDSISLLPLLRDRHEDQETHDYLYWEFYEQGSAQAVRMGRWKGIRKPMFAGEVQLFDLESDLGEQKDVASIHPEVVEQVRAVMDREHVPSTRWEAATRD